VFEQSELFPHDIPDIYPRIWNAVLGYYAASRIGPHPTVAQIVTRMETKELGGDPTRAASVETIRRARKDVKWGHLLQPWPIKRGQQPTDPALRALLFDKPIDRMPVDAAAEDRLEKLQERVEQLERERRDAQERLDGAEDRLFMSDAVLERAITDPAADNIVPFGEMTAFDGKKYQVGIAPSGGIVLIAQAIAAVAAMFIGVYGMLDLVSDGKLNHVIVWCHLLLPHLLNL
jgi:hypothetical protein